MPQKKPQKKIVKTLKFGSDHSFRMWLKKKQYTKDAFIGVHTKGGSRVGSAFEKRRKGKRVWEVDLY